MQSVVDASTRPEDFQRYLEKSGVVDALTKVLVGLYESPDKPANAVDFVKDYLGSVSSVSPNLQSLVSQCDSLTKLLAERDAEIAALKKQVEQLHNTVNHVNIGSSSNVIPIPDSQNTEQQSVPNLPLQPESSSRPSTEGEGVNINT